MAMVDAALNNCAVKVNNGAVLLSSMLRTAVTESIQAEMKRKKNINQFVVTDVCKNEKKGTFSQIKFKKKKMSKTSPFIEHDQRDCDEDKNILSPKHKSKYKEVNQNLKLKHLDSVEPFKSEEKLDEAPCALHKDSKKTLNAVKGFAKKTEKKKRRKLKHDDLMILERETSSNSSQVWVDNNLKEPGIKKLKIDEKPKDALLSKVPKEKQRINCNKTINKKVKPKPKPQIKYKSNKLFGRPTLDDTGFMWNLKLEDFDKLNEPLEEVQDDEDEDDEQLSKNKKKKTKGERLQEMKEEEVRLRLVEQTLLEAENNPKTADQFDRALLAKPDSSDLWIKYIAHHLQATEIDKGRAVARRALQTINQRLDVERLNVWIALLNLENMFGTQENLKSTLDEALRTNDDFTVHSKMLTIYAESKKSQETEQLVSVMLRKYRTSPKCWLDCCSALMNINLPDKARNLVQRAISALPNKEHINLLCKFALMENTHGFIDQSQTLFEHILTSYPKRTDIWNVYVDMLVKSNKITVARQILERACRQKLPPRNMKMLFSKWISFEEKHGGAEKVEHVRKQAEVYVGNLTKNLE